MEENQTKFEGWARVEVMGRQCHIGLVTTQAFGQAVMFRIDSPLIPEREEIISRPKWSGSKYLPEGSVIKHDAIQATTVLVGAGSIYRIIPCTEEVAIKAIIETRTPDFQLLRIPDGRQIVAPEEEDDPEGEDESDEDDYA